MLNHVALERGAKRILHRLDRACEVDRALGEAYAGNNQRVRVREGLDLGDIGRVCAVAGAELVVIERLEMLGIVGRGQWRFAPQPQRNRDQLILAHGTDVPALGERRLAAAFERDAARLR